MTDQELIRALRYCGSEAEYWCNGCSGERCCNEGGHDKILLDAADRLEALLAENERLRDSARRLWAGMPRYCGDLPRFAMHADEPPSTEGVE